MIEVLSPAGNIEALKCAVANRADAVYLGLEQFNARLKADNFSTQNIKQWVDFCHFYAVKVYVTLNTCIKQKELAELDKLLIACEDAQVDAIIITDLAILPKAKKLCPSVALHASTQMGVHNYLGAKLLEKLGFSRVVLARECTISDIKEIKAHTNLEIEYFVHGAMCVCFSGQCLLSSIATGNSGNRGLCLQPCRKEYTESLTGKKGYMISPKDQCLINHIKQLEDAGVDSLKIEGRLKSAAYVGLITAKYKKAVSGKKIDEEDFSQMKKVYNRGGFCEGYAFSEKNEILHYKNQNHLGEKVGEVVGVTKCKNYYKIEVKADCDLNNGDGVKVFENDVNVGGFEVCIIEKKSNIIKLHTKNAFKIGDKVHITFDNNLNRQYLQTQCEKVVLDLLVEISSNRVVISSNYKNKKICFEQSANFEPAKNITTLSQDIINQFSKTGSTPFEFKNIEVALKENLFIPKSLINGIRRDFVESCYYQIAKINNEIFKAENLLKSNLNDYDKSFFGEVISEDCSNIVIARKNDFEYLSRQKAMKIVLNYNNFDKTILNYAKNHNNLYVRLPKIAMTDDLKIILEFLKTLPKNVGIYAENMYHIYLAIVQNRSIIGGIGLNLFNNQAAKVLNLKCFVASPELSKNEIEDLGLPVAVFAFGYLPVMTFCHCPVQHFTGCSCADCKFSEYSLKDKYGEFKVRRIKIKNCYFEMLNSCCNYIALQKLPKGCFALLDMTEFENSEEIVSKYLDNSCIILNNSLKLTKGQFDRGVQ